MNEYWRMQQGNLKNVAEEKTCLVTGATGAVGPALIKNLLEKGYQVRILIRAGSDTEIYS